MGKQNPKIPTNATKPSDAARIQSTQAKAGNPVGTNSFASRLQSAAAKNVNRGIVNPSGATSGVKATPGGKAGRK